MPTKRRHRQRTPHYDRRRRVVKLGAGPNPWWDPLGEGLCVWAAYQPMGAASFAASLVDLTGSGNNAGDPGGAATPVWNAIDGWIGDGVGDYLTTTFIAQNDQSQSALCRFTWGGGANQHLFGSNDAAWSDFRLLDNSGGGVFYVNNQNVIVAPALGAGNLGIGGNRGYRNGVAEGAAMAAGGAPVSPVYILCANAAGVAAQFFGGRIQALVLYDCVLTAAQMLAVYTAMTAL